MSTTTDARARRRRRSSANCARRARSASASAVKDLPRKIFPDHWSFMLGEIALYSFIILLLTGTFLTFCLVPSVGRDRRTTAPTSRCDGVSRCPRPTPRRCDISFDVRGGLLMRQIHHWAALLFVAAITVHMFRVFFTGAFRKPRELNWVIGFTLRAAGDRRGLRRLLAARRPALRHRPADRRRASSRRSRSSAPTWRSSCSAAQFPGEAFIPRLYTIHVLLLPGDLPGADHRPPAAGLAARSTPSTPARAAPNDNVVGYPLHPGLHGQGRRLLLHRLRRHRAAWARLFTINPIWMYGPYDPSPVTAGSQPDWYMGFARRRACA